MYVRSCCFCHQTYCFFDVLVAIDVVVPKKNQMNDRTTPGSKLQNLVVLGSLTLYGMVPLCASKVIPYSI